MRPPPDRPVSLWAAARLTPRLCRTLAPWRGRRTGRAPGRTGHKLHVPGADEREVEQPGLFPAAEVHDLGGGRLRHVHVAAERSPVAPVDDGQIERDLVAPVELDLLAGVAHSREVARVVADLHDPAAQQGPVGGHGDQGRRWTATSAATIGKLMGGAMRRRPQRTPPRTLSPMYAQPTRTTPVDVPVTATPAAAPTPSRRRTSRPPAKMRISPREHTCPLVSPKFLWVPEMRDTSVPRCGPSSALLPACKKAETTARTGEVLEQG